MHILDDVIATSGPLYSMTNAKVIIAGSKVELMTYERPIIYGLSKNIRKNRSTGPRPVKDMNGIEKSGSKKNIKRSLDNLRRKVNSNFDSTNTALITLSFSDDITDITIANNYFSSFTKRLRPYYPGIRYIACPEKHSNRLDVIHYHMLYRLDDNRFIPASLEVVRSWIYKSILPIHYNPNINLKSIWGNGEVHAKRLTAEDVGLTFARYVTKANQQFDMFNKKKYIPSRNLVEPLILYGTDALKYLVDNDLPNREPAYSTTYTSEYAGQIVHSYYNFSLTSSVA